MTFIFAALLGNLLAWCVHTFTWWLRERVFSVIAIFGIFGFLWWIVLSSTVIEIADGGLFIVILAFLMICVTSRIQSKYLTRIEDARILAAMLAFLAELLFAQFIANPLHFFAQMSRRVDYSDGVFLTSFWLTLFTLALIRPQVVKVQKWLWQQVKPQRATNE